MNLLQAMQRAQHESANGYVQHVNKNSDGTYSVSDWFDGTTIASFEDGKRL